MHISVTGTLRPALLCLQRAGRAAALILATVALLGAQAVHARKATPPAAAQLINAVEARGDADSALAMQIYDLAELGYLEQRSSELLREALRAADFRVQFPVAGLPTAFVAEYGQGEPVIALLAEFDALPGISQSPVSHREVSPAHSSGHACGHHLLGTASVSAGIVLAQWLAQSGQAGTVRVYGTPAEEGGSGKVYMVRAGLFDDVSASLTWHPGDRNEASARTSLANRSAIFRYSGVSAHAAQAPEKARSALDGVEAFNHMVNLMREHVPQETRIHYVITAGGLAPNVVPDHAEVYYYVRHPDARELVRIWARVEQAAQGAAMGTGTTVDAEIMHGNLSLLPNERLARLMHERLMQVGGITYTEQERRFADEVYDTLNGPGLELGSEQQVQPFASKMSQGSTDVGDVSWTTPTAELRTATWVAGTNAHTWQAIAAGGTSIGIKGMQLATKTMALTAIDLYTQPQLLKQIQAEFEQRVGDYDYTPLLGDRDPPLDYRLR